MFECSVVMMMMMMVVVVFMSMGRDYVSELRLPTGLLFIPLAIYKH
jgi:ACR3 family arsenite efflux pump ArsB